MSRHPHRKGRKRQRKKREHGLRKDRKIRAFRSRWAAMCWARGSGSRVAYLVARSGGSPLVRLAAENWTTGPVQVGPLEISSRSAGIWPVPGWAIPAFRKAKE
jgi:hypothetical protein